MPDKKYNIHRYMSIVYKIRKTDDGEFVIMYSGIRYTYYVLNWNERPRRKSQPRQNRNMSRVCRSGGSGIGWGERNEMYMSWLAAWLSS